ncbi:MAG: 5-bromo-4-chloroindolyl phosphate hydrolysis family protein [Eubacteriales bacterium]
MPRREERIKKQEIVVDGKKTVKIYSPLPPIFAGITFLLFAFLGKLRSPIQFVVAAVVSLIVYKISRKINKDKQLEILEKKKFEALPLSKDREIDELMKLGNDYLRRIHQFIIDIVDTGVKASLSEIEVICRNIFEQIGTRKHKIPQLNRFMEYYMPTTFKLLESYRKIEQQGVSGSNTAELKARVEEVMPIVKKAFKQELDNLYKDEMLDITTDITVLQSVLTKNGLL